jgi:hypothetical protein
VSRLPSPNEALALMLAQVGPLDTEAAALDEALGRALAQDVDARRDQPPFRASAMDGWAVRRGDALSAEARLRIIGESAAGRGFDGDVGAGEAVRRVHRLGLIGLVQLQDVLVLGFSLGLRRRLDRLEVGRIGAAVRGRLVLGDDAADGGEDFLHRRFLGDLFGHGVEAVSLRNMGAGAA